MATMFQAQDSNKRFRFKLTVGYGSMAIGDINAVLKSQENFFSYLASGGTKDGEFKELNKGFEFEGEYIIDISEHFGLGIGAGYILRKEQSKVSLCFMSSSHNHKISAIPIKVTAYYSAPIASKLNFYLSGGIGYYIGKINYNTLWEEHWWIPGFTFDYIRNVRKAEGDFSGFSLRAGIKIKF
jgi:hypothetical protein